LFQLTIVAATELYPKSPVGFREEDPNMTLSEPHLPTRRRQILDDQTGAAEQINARQYGDSWADGDSSIPGDAWVKDFVGRLAARIRSLGENN
jgi:hypothetical protein